MRIGEAVSAGFRGANEGWRVIAVSFGFGLVMSVSQRILLPNSTPAPSPSPAANPIALMAGGMGMLVLALGLGVLWTVWLGGALVWLKNRFDGAENSWAGLVEGGRRLFWALCWVMSLQGILGMGPLFVAGLLGALLARSLGIGVTALLVAIGVLAGLAVFILLTFGACALAERQQGAKTALKDSALFVRAHLGGTLGLLTALFLVSAAVVLAFAIPLILLALALKLPISAQQQSPLLMEVPLQLVASYVFFFVLAAQYAYYRGNQPASPEPLAERSA